MLLSDDAIGKITDRCLNDSGPQDGTTGKNELRLAATSSMQLNNNMKPAYFKLAFSGLVIAIFVIMQYLTHIASFMYALVYLYPFLTFPLAFASFLSAALTGGFGIFDMVGGFIVGLLTGGSILLIRRFRWNEWLTGLPIFLFTGLLMPIWLSFLTHVSYKVLAPGMLAIQIIPAVFGVILMKQLKKVLPKM
jgi:hypothetical protein